MKFALAMICSLLLVIGQSAALSAPAAGICVAKHSDCGCGGKMSCCRHASAPQPATTAAPTSSQNQIVAPPSVPLAWELTSRPAVQISPAVSASLSADAAPLFVRHCVWLI